MSVAVITRADSYRDGGSVSVTFTKPESDREYTLLFPIKEAPSNPREQWRKFSEPILEVYTRTSYASPITGVSSPSFAKESSSVSWESALELVESMADSLAKLVPRDLEIYEYMLAVAKCKGTYNGS